MRLFAVFLIPTVAFADVSPRRGCADPRRLNLERVVEGGDEFVFGAAASSDGRLIAAGRRDGKIAMWGPAGHRPLAGHEGYVHAVAFARGARLLASAGADRTVRLWDVESGRLERTLRGHAGAVHAVAFSADGRRLVSGGSDGGRVWQLPAGDALAVLRHGAPVFGVSATARLAATAGADGVVRVWSLEDGREMRGLTGHDKPVAAAAFSPDGALVASAGFDGKVRLWGTESGRLLRTIDAHSGIASAVAFSPDGLVLASAGADGIRFWDTRGRALGARRAGSTAATAVRFAEGGATVVATFADNRVRLWGVRARTPLEEAPAERAPGFLGVSYSSDGGALVGSVVGGSQAEQSGFRANDLIIGVDATPITQADDFLNFMRGTFEGDEITLRIRRDGEERYIRAKLGRWH